MKHINKKMNHKQARHWPLLILSVISVLNFQSATAQTWGAEQNLAGWWQDPATPGTGVHPTLNNDPFFNAALLSSMPTVISGGSGVTYNARASNNETFTYHQLQGVDACNPAAAQTNNEYFTTTIVIRPDIRTLRISRLTFSNFEGDGVPSTDYQLSLAARDITTGGALVFAKTGADIIYQNDMSTNHTLNSATAGWNFIRLLPGHTYEIRLYINKPPTDCGGGSTKRLDNPTIDVQMVDPVAISGTTFNDYDGPSNGINNLSGAQVSGLNAVLVDANGIVVGRVPVNTSNGTYSFPGIDPLSSASFRVMLTTASPTVGQAAPATATLPAGWVSTGENNGTGNGNDGAANGISASFTPTGNTGNINFGMNQPPVATNNSLTNQPPGTPATVPNILANDSDPNGSTLSPANISLVTPSGATAVITDAQGDVTGFTVPGQGTWTLNADGSVTFSPQAGFTGDPTPINYTVRDAGGLTSNQASISIDFNPPVTVSGTLFTDGNGQNGGVNGTPKSGVTVNLYASNGVTVLATTTTDGSGNYNFPNIVPGNYVVGVTPPAGFQHASSTDATPTNGLTTITVGSTNTSGVNFGIQQPPVAHPKTQTVAGPSGNAIPAGAVKENVTGTDPEDGVLGNANTIVIRQLPANATMLYNGVPVTLNQQITGFNPALVSYTGINLGSTSITFNYAFLDAGGLQSAPAAYTVNWLIALPVTLQSFTATVLQAGNVLLKWQVGAEENFKGYEVEYAPDAASFSRIAEISGGRADGNYSFTYNQPGATGYYRLKMVDIDGRMTWSRVIKVDLKETVRLCAYPNPVLTTATVKGIQSGDILRLYNAQGALLQTVKATGITIELDLNRYPHGVYGLEVMRNDQPAGKIKLLKGN